MRDINTTILWSMNMANITWINYKSKHTVWFIIKKKRNLYVNWLKWCQIHSSSSALISTNWSLISIALDWSTSSVASASAVQVDGGLVCLSHSDNISCKRSLVPSSSLFILSRTDLDTPSSIPIVFQCVARGRSFLNASFNSGFPPIN